MICAGLAEIGEWVTRHGRFYLIKFYNCDRLLKKAVDPGPRISETV